MQNLNEFTLSVDRTHLIIINHLHALFWFPVSRREFNLLEKLDPVWVPFRKKNMTWHTLLRLHSGIKSNSNSYESQLDYFCCKEPGNGKKGHKICLLLFKRTRVICQLLLAQLLLSDRLIVATSVASREAFLTCLTGLIQRYQTPGCPLFLQTLAFISKSKITFPFIWKRKLDIRCS